MTTTANQQYNSTTGSNNNNDEDIAAIAKQISDHAEAIYQTWKSRGIAPTEILNHCHNNIKDETTSSTNIDNNLTNSGTTISSSSISSPSSPQSPQVMELLTNTSNNNLEKLVNKFVLEDKARIARQQKIYSPKPFTASSTIQYALQKFEKKLGSPTSGGGGSLGGIPSLTSSIPANSFNGSSSSSSYSNIISSPLYNKKTTTSPTNITSNNIDIDCTIETIYPNDYSEMGNSTWPLKSNQINNSNNNIINSDINHLHHDTIDNITTTSSNNKYYTLPNTPNNLSNTSTHYIPTKYENSTNNETIIKTKTIPIEVITNNTTEQSTKIYNSNIKNNNIKYKNSNEYLDEVKREEEKLINALKTGIIIENNQQQQNQLKTNKIINTSAKDADLIKSTINNIPINRSSSNTRLNNRIETTVRSSINRNELSNSANVSSASSLLNSPIRPFLTRGSVAERVLLFEKCPTELILEKRPKRNSIIGDVHSRIQTYAKDTNDKNGPPPHTTLQRHAKANRNQLIPRFHYPFGKPCSQKQIDKIIENVRSLFVALNQQRATKFDFATITKVCDLPLYWKSPLFSACGGDQFGYVEMNSFIDYIKDLYATCHDSSSKFMRIITRSPTRMFMVPQDLTAMVQDVVDTHPGLGFLKLATEFHSRYVHTVISRIFYCVNQSWSGKISLSEMRRSDLLRIIELLEDEQDINQITAYFSYEHFYVIYCKFWELDTDHDLFIDNTDLARHSDHALSSRIIDRIFSGSVTRSKNTMTYTEFVWFLLAEEDKTHHRAIEYWFRCMDLDGDGYLSMYELEYFYDEQLQRMDAIGIECLPFEDCLCQMLDMIKPETPGKVSLKDLKRCKMTPIFFDTFFNLEKYLDHEQRDPFASQRDDDTEMSDWDRFAAEEYEMLVAEEGGTENQDDMYMDQGTDILSPNLDQILYWNREQTNNLRKNNGPIITNEDDGDYENGLGSLSSDDSGDYADSDDCSL